MTNKKVKRTVGWVLLVALGALAVCFATVFYITTPRPLPESEVVGHWEAEPGMHGQGDFHEDGTFVLQGLSINVITGEDAVGTFSMSGSWSVREGKNNLELRLESYYDTGDNAVSGSDLGLSSSTLGWGKNRQLYFSDGEESNRFLMNRVSDVPGPH